MAENKCRVLEQHWESQCISNSESWIENESKEYVEIVHRNSYKILNIWRQLI